MKKLVLSIGLLALTIAVEAQSKKEIRREKVRAEKEAKKEFRSAKKGNEDARVNIEEKLYHNKEELEKEEKEMFKRAGLEEIDGLMVQAINREYHSKANRVKEDDSLGQVQRQQQLQEMNRERQERILSIVGSSKKAGLDKEEKTWRESRGLGDWHNGYGNENPKWKN